MVEHAMVLIIETVVLNLSYCTVVYLVGYDSFLVYSRVQSIDFASLTEDETVNTPFPSIDDRKYVRNVIGLAFDYKNNRLFYSDIQLGTIYSVTVDFKTRQNPIQELASGTVIQRWLYSTRRLIEIS